MKCPKCGTPQNGVTGGTAESRWYGANAVIIDSRPLRHINAVRRHRRCPVCHTRWTTHETIVEGSYEDEDAEYVVGTA